MIDFCPRTLRTLAAMATAFLAQTGFAQSSNVTVYGTVDQYLGAFHSSSGTTMTGLYDGAFLRSRWGLRGSEDLGGGLSARFQLEAGLAADTGSAADGSRSFDRQAWVGLAGRFGEVRFGRQNTPIFYKGDYIDFSSRTLGSVVNAFGVPSRYDNAIGYISPRIAGVQFDAQLSLAETAAGLTRQAVVTGALDWVGGPWRAGAALLRAQPPGGAAQPHKVAYDNAYLNYDHGQGKIYLAYVRSNNSTAGAAGNNVASILGNVGGTVAGTNADVNRFYRIWQISADYRVTPLLRVGALYGAIDDTSGSGRDASGWGIGAYYDLSRRTMLYALANSLNNKGSAGFRPAGSAGVSPNFSAAADVNGRRLDGTQVGILHRF